jgi:hypothetical protein
MAPRSKILMQLNVMSVEDMKVENGVLNILLDVQIDGAGQRQIRVRLDMENAYDLRSRLSGGMVTASNQLHA